MLGSFGTSLELRRWSFKIDSWPAWPRNVWSSAALATADRIEA